MVALGVTHALAALAVLAVLHVSCAAPLDCRDAPPFAHLNFYDAVSSVVFLQAARYISKFAPEARAETNVVISPLKLLYIGLKASGATYKFSVYGCTVNTTSLLLYPDTYTETNNSTQFVHYTNYVSIVNLVSENCIQPAEYSTSASNLTFAPCDLNPKDASRFFKAYQETEADSMGGEVYYNGSIDLTNVQASNSGLAWSLAVDKRTVQVMQTNETSLGLGVNLNQA